MFTILYPYRNREPERVKRSLDSLVNQTNRDFEVVFVDYGSTLNIAVAIEELLREYDFVRYIYSHHRHQPWSRAKAINIGARQVATDYFFTADVDMIFSPHFVAKLQELKNPFKAYYFKVGFLDKQESSLLKEFNDYSIAFSSGVGAQGLSLFPLEALVKINGFDEFFHCWGAEDADIHNRLTTNGCDLEFYNEKILLLHQWHPNYRKKETTFLNKVIQLNGIVELNHRHLKYNLERGITKVNSGKWGTVISESEYDELSSLPTVKLSNEVREIDHFLFVELPRFQNGILSVCFAEDSFQSSLKYKIKKVIGKKVPKYYSLKEINDKLLLHIISFYHQFPYIYTISDDLKTISFKIKK